MPKTKNAFALREFFHSVLDARHPQYLSDAVSASDYFFDFVSKGYTRPNWIKPDYNNRLDDFLGVIELIKYNLRRTEFLIKLLQSHLIRLNKLLGKAIEKTFERSADEKLQKTITRLNFLHKAYENILSSMRDSFDSDIELLSMQRGSFQYAMKQEFGIRLRIARKAKGFTGVELAKWLGISQTSYSEYERGKTEPHLSTIYSLAKKLNVTADYLLCLDK